MFCPYGWMEISMQIALGCPRLIKCSPIHSQRSQTRAHPRCTGSSEGLKKENCSVGILPNIMGVRGYTWTHCTSTGLLVLWVGANRKHIDEWRCSILWCAVAVQHPLKCFSHLFCCKTSTERSWNDPISKRHTQVLLMLFDRSPTWGGGMKTAT